MALATGLAGLGMRVALATFGPRLSEDQRRRVDQQEALEVFESEFSPEWTPGFWADQRPAEDWLLQIGARFAPDAIHLNGLSLAALPWNRPTVVVAHRCMASWWLDVKGKLLPKQWDFYRHQATLGLRSAGLVISSTHTALASLREHYGPFPAERVIRHGWSAPQQEVGTKKGFIITAQRLWDESSNLQALEVCAPFLSWPIFCAGETLDENGRRARLQARNMCCLGALPEQELERWLLDSSIYVVPARSADCQVSVLQAAWAGCALVLGNNPVLKEVWNDAAVFVPPDEPEAIRFAVDRLIRDADRRNDLAARARRRAGELSLSVMTGEYCIAYHELMVSGMHSPGALSHAVGV